MLKCMAAPNAGGEQMTKAISLCWSTARLMVLLLASTLQCDSQTIDRSPLSRDLHRPEPWLANRGNLLEPAKSECEKMWAWCSPTDYVVQACNAGKLAVCFCSVVPRC